MAQVKVRFYLPLRDNDGRDLKAEVAAVEMELYALIGGWSLTSVVRGLYRMADNTAARDESNAYEIVTDDSRASEIKSLLLSFKAKTTQEAIYFEVQPSSVEFI